MFHFQQNKISSTYWSNSHTKSNLNCLGDQDQQPSEEQIESICIKEKLMRGLVKQYFMAKWLYTIFFFICVVCFVYRLNLFGVLRRFQHYTGHIKTGSWKGRGNQYIQFARVVHCKLLTNGKQLPAFPLKAVTGIEPRPQRWEARVLPLCHHGPCFVYRDFHTMLLHVLLLCFTRSLT